VSPEQIIVDGVLRHTMAHTCKSAAGGGDALVVPYENVLDTPDERNLSYEQMRMLMPDVGPS
jgi:hypothetical protein